MAPSPPRMLPFVCHTAPPHVFAAILPSCRQLLVTCFLMQMVHFVNKNPARSLLLKTRIRCRFHHTSNQPLRPHTQPVPPFTAKTNTPSTRPGRSPLQTCARGLSGQGRTSPQQRERDHVPSLVCKPGAAVRSHDSLLPRVPAGRGGGGAGQRQSYWQRGQQSRAAATATAAAAAGGGGAPAARCSHDASFAAGPPAPRPNHAFTRH